MKLIIFCLFLLQCEAFRVQRIASLNRRQATLQMAIHSSAQGVPAALVEERDACGVGFIASLK